MMAREIPGLGKLMQFILDENFGLELPTDSKELIKSPNDWHDYY